MNQLLKFLFLFVLIQAANSIFAQRSTGLLLDNKAYNKVPHLPEFSGSKYNDIPIFHSLRPFAPEIGDQGRIGSCTGWATGYAALTISRAVRDQIKDQVKINNIAQSALYIYNNIKITEDCNSGAFLHSALEFLKQNGDCLNEDFSSDDCNTLPPSGFDSLHELIRIKEYAAVYSILDSDIVKVNKVKKSLIDNKPVIVGLNISNDFLMLRNEIWEQKEDAPSIGGHAMCIIGYDEVLEAFEVMNSWGTSWGDKGFVWVPYDVFSRNALYGYQMILDDKNLDIKIHQNDKKLEIEENLDEIANEDKVVVDNVEENIEIPEELDDEVNESVVIADEAVIISDEDFIMEKEEVENDIKEIANLIDNNEKTSNVIEDIFTNIEESEEIKENKIAENVEWEKEEYKGNDSDVNVEKQERIKEVTLSGTFDFKNLIGYEKGDDNQFLKDKDGKKVFNFGTAIVSFKDSIYLLEEDKWRNGDMFQLIAANVPEGNYVYVCSVDPDNQLNIHWPKQAINNIPVANYIPSKFAEICIPGINRVLRLEKEGLNNLLVLYSNKPIPDYNQKFTDIRDSEELSFYSKVTQVFGSILVHPSDIIYDNNSMNFVTDLKPNGAYIVPLILEVNSIRN